jgi:YD repeat-containing protein
MPEDTRFLKARKLLLATTLAVVTTTAIAQSPMPQTTVIKDPDGRIIGTATLSGDMIVYRDANGGLTGSSRVAADGTETFYDPNGKVTGTSTTSGNVTTIRNSEGEITSTRTREGSAMIVRDAAGQIVGKGEPAK